MFLAEPHGVSETRVLAAECLHSAAYHALRMAPDSEWACGSGRIQIGSDVEEAELPIHPHLAMYGRK